MPQMFAYKARNLSGRLITGRVEAESQGDAVFSLREKGCYVVEIKPAFYFWPVVDRLFRPKIRTRDLAVFCSQFTTMSGAGIPLLQCLNILARQTENRRLSRILQQVGKDIEKGRSLSEAFGAQRDFLPAIFTDMLAAGEVSGNLDQALERLAAHFEKEQELREKIRSAMAYPLVVSLFASLVVTGLLVFLVPVYVEVFEQAGAELPLPTRILIKTSFVITEFWYLILICLFILYLALKRFTVTPRGRKTLDGIILKLPVIGKLAHKAIIARFARTLATLLRSGVPLLHSLETAAKVSGNTVAAGEITAARENIKAGQRMSPVFHKGNLFSPMALSMIAVGEESGALDSLMEKLAQFYEREVEASVARLSGVAEPLMIAGVGLMVAFIALAIYMPLFGISAAIQSGSGLP